MRKDTYLNAVLTVNAVLLGGLLWSQVADRPVLATPALAQSGPNSPTIFPNASKQRVDIIHGLRDVQRAVTDLKGVMGSGKLKVEVTNLSDIKLSSD